MKKERDAMRPIQMIPRYTEHANGSVLACFGGTKVLCTVMVEEGVPNFIEGDNAWLTAEYSMLPGSTFTRKKRRTAAGEIDARSTEIQRFIGRSLRSCIDLKDIGRMTFYVDCDVLQADGGTRTTAVSGAYLALRLAVEDLLEKGYLKENPLQRHLAAVSVGYVDGEAVLDLCFHQDCRAEVDLNVVMDDQGNIIEIQGTAEERVFSREELDELLNLAEKGILQILEEQEKSFYEMYRSNSQSW